jgi:hypothetical protein
MRFITTTRTIAIFMTAMARRIFLPRQREVSPPVGNARRLTRAANGAMRALRKRPDLSPSLAKQQDHKEQKETPSLVAPRMFDRPSPEAKA